MDITLVALAFFILLATIFLLLFLINNVKKKSFKAEDGSLFDNQSDLDLYNSLYDKTKALFSFDHDKVTSEETLGFQKPFLIKLTKEGFQDLKTLILYRKQLQALLDLINS